MNKTPVVAADCNAYIGTDFPERERTSRNVLYRKNFEEKEKALKGENTYQGDKL